MKIRSIYSLIFISLVGLISCGNSSCNNKCDNIVDEEHCPYFMGIPIDGDKDVVIDSLIHRGFAPKLWRDVGPYTGMFDGVECNIEIVTNHDKVSRIVVCNRYRLDEDDVKRRYNQWVMEYSNNSKYTIVDTVLIPLSCHLSYEMDCNHKTYESVFTQTAKDGETRHPVWMRIYEDGLWYYVCIYYDNILNQPHGEDL